MSVLRRTNPYEKTVWLDRIVDVTTGQVLQEGTRFNQRRANNIEEGIYGAYNYIIDIETLVKRIQAQLEIDGRVPGNLGSFYDTFDGTATRMALDMTSADVTADITAGATLIPVASTDGFTPMTYATIYDANNYEHVLIAAVNAEASTVTVQALSNGYAKGAKLTRSTASVDSVAQALVVAPLTTYTVDVMEVI